MVDRRVEFGNKTAVQAQGEAQKLMQLLGVPLSNFRKTPKGRVQTSLLQPFLERMFAPVFASVNSAYRDLLDRSSPNFRKGAYENFGPPGAKVTGRLYNALGANLEVRGVRFVGRIFTYAIGYDTRRTPHFRYLDEGTSAHSMPPNVILAWANRKFNWGLTVSSGRFNSADYAGIKVPMPNGDLVSVSQAAFLLGSSIRKFGTRPLFLQEAIVRFVRRAIEQLGIEQEWLSIALGRK